MVSRRQQTNYSSAAPVRFYKIVALSFLLITIVLLGLVVFMSSKRATIVITTKPEPVDVSYDMDVTNKDAQETVGGMVTTTAVSVLQTFEPTGSRVESGVAGGVVTLYNKSNVAQPLVATTRLQTADGILFRLRNRVTVPANGSVEAQVYADKEGVGNNLPPSKFTIPGLAEAKQQVIYAESTLPMNSGSTTIGILSDDDVKKAEKVVTDALLEKGKNTLSTLYPDKHGVFLVTDSAVALDGATKVGDEVSSFAMKGSGTVVAVFYDPEKIRVAAVDTLMKKSVTDTDSIEPSKDLPTVSLREYAKDKGTATVTIFQSGRAVLNPESKQIQKVMLFGKTKEEVRRYLLSLKRVHSVDVQFRPAWMMTVPHVPDHVQVIVKNIE
ncbi:MAG TPA: hypothetical protein VEA18_00460 [Candidatus Kapabacteria bacterium]|nr:hypothetical protein [Candidatus Kapabacteria bacterium]